MISNTQFRYIADINVFLQSWSHCIQTILPLHFVKYHTKKKKTLKDAQLREIYTVCIFYVMYTFLCTNRRFSENGVQHKVGITFDPNEQKLNQLDNF
jgi:hypothetical protein